MEASLKQCGFANYYKAYSRLLRKEEAQDCVVPDTMPDIAELVSSWGSVLIRSKDVGDGRVRVEANVPAKVTFLPEGGEGLCCLDVNIPLYFSAEDAAIRSGAVCVADLKLRTLETRMLNPRKVTVRAEAELRLDCYEAGETAFCTADESCAREIHVREREITVAAVSTVTEKTFVLTDDLTLPEEKPSAELILGQQAALCVEETKTVGSKVILKGRAKSVLFYQSPEGQTDTAEFFTEFSQIIDTEVETEESFAAASLLLSGLYYDVAGGYNGRTLRMEAHAVVQLTLHKNHTVSCLTDAYSNVYALELQREQRETLRILRAETVQCTAREDVATPRAAAEVMCCQGRCLSAAREESGVTLSAEVQLLCRDAEGAVFSVRQTVTASAELRQAPGETLMICGAALGEISAVPTPKGLELRLTAEVNAYAAETGEADYIRGISYDETALLDLSDRPSLVLMQVCSGDDLWQLARENCSTPEAICAVNGLDGETEPWKKLLLIPRTV